MFGNKNIIDLSKITVKTPSNNPSNNPINSPSNEQSNFPIDTNVYNDIMKQIKTVKLPKVKKIKAETKNIDSNNDYSRRKNILVLQMYINEFPSKLKAWKNSNFEKMSDEELVKLKGEFDFIVSSKCNLSLSQSYALQLIQLIEIMGPSVGLKLDGLSNQLNDEVFLDDIKCTTLKYMGTTLIKTEPEYRVLIRLLTTVITLHQYNSRNPKRIDNNDGEKINIINSINSKYTDL